MTISAIPVTGIGEIGPDHDLAAEIAAHSDLRHGDVVVVTQKIVSKAEGRIVVLDPEDPEAKRRLVESESVRILRRRGDLVISQTRHGFVCANAGVDLSNVDAGTAALLPHDADRSAHRIRTRLAQHHQVEVAVIISDTFGRPWRNGVTDVAIGVSGIAAVVDLRGTPDGTGRTLEVTEVAIADEIAAMADLVMGKADRVPVAIVRGLPEAWRREATVAGELVRAPSDDLFR